MEAIEFMAMIQRLGLIARTLEQTDVEGLLGRLEQAEAMAPVFDPSPQGAERLETIRELVVEACRFRKAAVTYRQRMAEVEVAAAQRQLAGGSDGESRTQPGTT